MKNIEGKFEVKIPNMDPMMDRKIKEAINMKTLWRWIKYLLICCENDNDYKKVNGESSNTSNWDQISDNQLQMS